MCIRDRATSTHVHPCGKKQKGNVVPPHFLTILPLLGVNSPAMLPTPLADCNNINNNCLYYNRSQTATKDNKLTRRTAHMYNNTTQISNLEVWCPSIVQTLLYRLGWALSRLSGKWYKKPIPVFCIKMTVTRNKHKIHLYRVPSFGICNLYLCFIYFTSIVISQLHMYVWYVSILKINQ